MNMPSSGNLILGRGDDAISGPTLRDVLDAMSTVFDDEGRSVAPELVLDYFESAPSVKPVRYSLHLVLALHPKLPTTWVVHYLTSVVGGPALLLSSKAVTQAHFAPRNCCGLISEYRIECLISDTTFVQAAIEWFLEHHARSPQLVWLDDSEAMRDVDNSIFDGM